jgi:IS605 OrfB family transposase
LVVLDGSKQIYKEIIDFADSNKKSSTNKRKHFLVEASKHIAELCKHYRCNLVIEDLKIKSKDHGRGKGFNRLVNNMWNSNLLVNNLKKRSNLLGIKCVEISCAFSSFVGQMLNYEDYDSIAAAIEIGRRGQLKLLKQKYEVLPTTLNLSQLSNQWKEEITVNGINSWREFYKFVQKSKPSYRSLFTRKQFTGNSFNLLCCNSCIYVHKIT